MTDASYIKGAFVAPKQKAPSLPLPKPQPFGGPVFIHDCVTPLAGETVLSLLMKRMMKDDQP
ncbi:hypothetical protein Z945_511 [Sulfitobacter noctilucae]|uniref:hypothetical protein n=1 Tax=Sulfitobacter noctilucae TaxID=1342302 RepID=UPI0004696551|nr:hypothetical protein [Sulfitobacter noctilucae]KIN65468.1 hypothetical protein Z945_511 [Sulfitobacter noctilucae]